MINKKSFLKKLASFDGSKYLLKLGQNPNTQEAEAVPTGFHYSGFSDPNGLNIFDEEKQENITIEEAWRRYLKKRKSSPVSDAKASPGRASPSPASSSRYDPQILEIQKALNALNNTSGKIFIEESVGGIKFYKKDKNKALEEDGFLGPQTQMAIRLFSSQNKSSQNKIDYDSKNKTAFLDSVKKEIPKAQPSASLPSTGITSADIPAYSFSAGPPSRVAPPKP